MKKICCFLISISLLTGLLAISITACDSEDDKENSLLNMILLAVGSSGSSSSSSLCTRTIKVVNCGVPVSLDAVSRVHYETAKNNFVLIYSGTSHSSQINTGITELSSRETWTAWTFEEGTYGLPGDLGNPDYTTWETRTRTYLNSHPNVNICMWSWCGQVGGADVEAAGRYIALMEDLISDYPDVTFIYMTGHCDGNGTTGSVNIENNKIREHCLANNRWLFDFADFDATNPAGVSYLDRNVSDHGNYDGGNWTEEWFAQHPEDWHSCSCAHSADGHQSLNCNRKAIGFVHMMARIAGWDGL